MTTAQRGAGAWWWTPVAGALFGVVTLVAAPVIGFDIGGISSVQSEAGWFSPFVGTFVPACLFWWVTIGWPRRLSLARGAFAGVLVGLFSYPVVLAIADLLQGEPVDIASLGTRSFGILELAVLTLLTTGFAAALIMAGVGALAALLLRPAYPRSPVVAPPVPWLVQVGAAVLVTLVVVLTAGFAWLSQLPLDSAALTDSRPPTTPPGSYDDAVAAFKAIEANEATLPLNPECGSRLLTHGTKVATAVVYLHGLTNCPLQAEELAQQLFALGYNVYVPRWPGHGEADQMTLALVELDAETMVASTDQAIDLAHGLGDEVTVVGMSAGGAMTAWSAQYRADVAHTVAVSPFLGPHFVPPWANRAAANLLLLMPDMMLPWNPLDPDGAPGMAHSYPRIPTHALAQFMRLGEVIEADARQKPPRAAGLGMLLNDADFAVNNELARQLIASWRGQGRQVDVEMLPRSDLLPHDLIDPRMPGARTELVYPLLLQMIRRQPATPQ